MPANRNFPLTPVTSLLIGASMWGVIWYPMRLLETQGLSGIWLTLILFAVALVVSLPYTIKAFAEFVTSPGHAALLMLAAGWTNIAFVEAVLGGNILRVLLLFYLSPLWAVILGWLILRERPSRVAIVSLLVAMIGALIMLWDGRMGFPLAEQPAGLVRAVLRFRVRAVERHHPQGAALVAVSQGIKRVGRGGGARGGDYPFQPHRHASD